MCCSEYCPDAAAATHVLSFLCALSSSLCCSVKMALAFSDICSQGIQCHFMKCQQKLRILRAGSSLQGLVGNQQLLTAVRPAL